MDKLPDDVKYAVNYLYELADKTMRPEVADIAGFVARIAYDRDYWKNEYHDFINTSVKNSQNAMGEIFMTVLEKTATQQSIKE